MLFPFFWTLALVIPPFSAAINVYIYRGAQCSMLNYGAGCGDLPPGTCCSAFDETWKSVRFVSRENHVIQHDLDHKLLGIAHYPGDNPDQCGPECGSGRECITCDGGIGGASWVVINSKHYHRPPLPNFNDDCVLGHCRRDVESGCEKTVQADIAIVDNHYFSVNSSVSQHVKEQLKDAVLNERSLDELHPMVLAHEIDPPN